MFSFTVIPGKQFAPEELIDLDKLNLLGQPTIIMTGSLSDFDDVSDVAPSDGDFLVWNSETGQWEPGGTEMVGATATTAGAKGLVKAPAAGDQEKYWAGDATWKVVPTTSAKDGADLYLATRYR